MSSMQSPTVTNAARHFPAPRPPRPRRKARSNPITILPEPRRFAVVQMDPVAMIDNLKLDDSEALAEAKAMVTKKYLMYLKSPLDLPMPTSEWCRYRAFPVATTLRPANADWGITPDMVLPIHPNTAHLKGESPFIDKEKPDNTFELKFKNCYFWIQSEMELRVRVKHDSVGYDNSKAVVLPQKLNIRMLSGFSEDFARICQFLMEQSEESHSRSATPALSDATMSLSTEMDASSDSVAQPAPLPTPSSPDQGPSMPPDPHIDAAMGRLPPFDDYGDDLGYPEGNYLTDDDSVPQLSSMEALFTMNLFGWDPDPATKYIPLVDAWFELEDHLSESTIPSPVDLWKEQQAIGAIINAAIERRNNARAAARSPPSAPVDIDTSSLEVTTHEAPTKSTPLKALSEIVAAGFNAITKTLQTGGIASPSPSRETHVAYPTGSVRSYSSHKQTHKRKWFS